MSPKSGGRHVAGAIPIPGEQRDPPEVGDPHPGMDCVALGVLVESKQGRIQGIQVSYR